MTTRRGFFARALGGFAAALGFKPSAAVPAAFDPSPYLVDYVFDERLSAITMRYLDTTRDLPITLTTSNSPGMKWASAGYWDAGKREWVTL